MLGFDSAGTVEPHWGFLFISGVVHRQMVCSILSCLVLPCFVLGRGRSSTDYGFYHDVMVLRLGVSLAVLFYIFAFHWLCLFPPFFDCLGLYVSYTFGAFLNGGFYSL